MAIYLLTEGREKGPKDEEHDGITMMSFGLQVDLRELLRGHVVFTTRLKCFSWMVGER